MICKEVLSLSFFERYAPPQALEISSQGYSEKVVFDNMHWDLRGFKSGPFVATGVAVDTFSVSHTFEGHKECIMEG